MHELNKSDDYSLLLKQVVALIDSEPDRLANMANIASFIYHMIPDLNWSGFYLLKGEDLVLGPFNDFQLVLASQWARVFVEHPPHLNKF